METFSRQHSDPLSSNRPLIPVLLDDCDVPKTLENIIWIDFRQKHAFESSLVELIAALKEQSSEPRNDSTLTTVGASEQPFSPVPNPYLRYSGGSVVSDSRMFFGRTETLERLERELTPEAAGRCFVLYGQKRCGKTSLLNQLQLRLVPPRLPVYVSVGMLSFQGADSMNPFIDLLITEMSYALKDRIPLAARRGTDHFSTGSTAVERLREALWAAEEMLLINGWKDPRVVFLIDEFTYLYEYIREGIVPVEFMRQWKALLELGAFNAVIAGQDSMLPFISAFPNEFGVTTIERISYLSLNDASRLADEPIRISGETRYRGNALSRVLWLTAGSPYYIQIFCSHLVEYLNQSRRLLITEADVSTVEASLTSGTSALDATSFDPLITAAGESVGLFPRDVYLQALSAIAQASSATAGAPVSVLTNVSNDPWGMLADLRARQVVVTDLTSAIHIRVGLFAEWLRQNRGCAGL